MKDADLTPFLNEKVVFFVEKYDEFLDICRKYPGQSRSEGGGWGVSKDIVSHEWLFNIRGQFDIIIISENYKYPNGISGAFSDFFEVELC